MLISDESKADHFKKHISDPEYGGESILYSQQISTIINDLQIDEVLDYGAGKGELAKNLVLDHGVKVHLYDPAIPDISDLPEPRDMTVCVNVLEYVEDAYLNNVLDDLQRCTKHITFIVVSEPLEKWLPMIMERFKLDSLVRLPEGFFLIARNIHGN